MKLPPRLAETGKNIREKFPQLAWSKFEQAWNKPTPAAPDQALNRHLEHTLLNPEAGRDEIRLLCQEAIDFALLAVCVNSYWIPYCAELLAGEKSKIISVTDFPLGAAATSCKSDAAARAVEDGALEIDMVLNRGLLKAGDFPALIHDIQSVRQAIAPTPLKVILETSELSEQEKIEACLACTLAQAHFVKTSTGLASGGATTEDVNLLRECVPPKIGVKASGGIRTLHQAKAMLKAGANRIGTSSGGKIMEELRHS